MYNTSNAYKTAIAGNIVVTKLEFTVNGTAYTEENILSGSFHITNQCTDTKDITLGAVYMGELKATLRGVNINRNSWRGVTIVPTFKLLIGEDTWESVPLGVYVVTEATHTASGVDVKAYDYMSNFDRNISMEQSAGYLYDFLVICATNCGVTLAQSEQEIKALPNGSVYFTYNNSDESMTYRDLLSWIAQTNGGFATINRLGQLEIRTYGTTSVDTLGLSGRLRGTVFSDYVTSYTGVSYVDLASQKTRYKGAEIDTGMTMNLGQNPFLQGEASITDTALGNILTAIGNITYVPFKASNGVRDVAYDLGDIITFTDGLAGISSLCCIQRYDYNLHNKYEFQGYGENPETANAKSKTDKNIAGLLADTETNSMKFYEYRNANIINIGNNETKQIVRMKLASNIITRCQIHININLASEAVTEGGVTLAIVTYMVDNYTEELQPKETYIDGNHVLHLMYILSMSANTNVYFIVKMKSSGGSISIDRQGVWVFAGGVGLVGDGQWNGEFDILDEIEDITLGEINVEEASEEAIISTQTPTTLTPSDIFHDITLGEIQIDGNVNEELRVSMHMETFERVTEEGDERVTEDADIRYTEEE